MPIVSGKKDTIKGTAKLIRIQPDGARVEVDIGRFVRSIEIDGAVYEVEPKKGKECAETAVSQGGNHE